MKQYDTARLFKALSEAPRLAILHMLAKYPDTLTVEQIKERMREAGYPLSQPTISHHLRRSSEARLITYRRDCTYHYYSLCPAAFADMADTLRAFTAETAVVV